MSDNLQTIIQTLGDSLPERTGKRSKPVLSDDAKRLLELVRGHSGDWQSVVIAHPQLLPVLTEVLEYLASKVRKADLATSAAPATTPAPVPTTTGHGCSAAMAFQSMAFTSPNSPALGGLRGLVRRQG